MLVPSQTNGTTWTNEKKETRYFDNVDYEGTVIEYRQSGGLGRFGQMFVGTASNRLRLVGIVTSLS